MFSLCISHWLEFSFNHNLAPCQNRWRYDIWETLKTSDDMSEAEEGSQQIASSVANCCLFRSHDSTLLHNVIKLSLFWETNLLTVHLTTQTSRWEFVRVHPWHNQRPWNVPLTLFVCNSHRCYHSHNFISQNFKSRCKKCMSKFNSVSSGVRGLELKIQF